MPFCLRLVFTSLLPHSAGNRPQRGKFVMIVNLVSAWSRLNWKRLQTFLHVLQFIKCYTCCLTGVVLSVLFQRLHPFELPMIAELK